MRNRTQFAGVAALVGVLASAPAVQADLEPPRYSFYNITNNNAGDAAIGEAQLFVEVTDATDADADGAQALFTFLNIGPEDSSICDVYFQDGTLLRIASIQNTLGDVEFTQPANPSDLPGGNSITPAFVTTAGFSTDSDPPVQPMGVNPGESLGILFDLQPGGTYGDVISELNDGRLRIGIRVQGYATEGSESFVNIPAPSAALLVLIGLGVFTLIKRRRSGLAG